MKMPRYIDAEKLIENAECGADPLDPWADMSFVRVEDIDNAPTEDVQPVVHAKWEKPTWSAGTKLWRCSACKSVVEIANYALKCYYDCCPYCGAKMDKE